MVAFTIAGSHSGLIISFCPNADWSRQHSVSLAFDPSSALLEDTLLLGEGVHAPARRRLSPRTVERHCLEHRNAHGWCVEMSC